MGNLEKRGTKWKTWEMRKIAGNAEERGKCGQAWKMRKSGEKLGNVEKREHGGNRGKT